MAMPQAVEKHRHYAGRRAFRIDRMQMERRGWKPSDVRMNTVRNGPLTRVLRGRPMHTEIDVVYTRAGWPVGDED